MGKRVEDLAALGGAPSFEEPLHVGRPNLGDRDALMARIEGMLDRNWLTNDGPLVREFEDVLCERLGVRHAVAMCNGTVALSLTAMALELTGEVILPSFTFVATAHALRWQGLEPVFADVDPRRHTLDPAQVAGLVTERTSAVLGVHLWGNPCDTDALGEAAAAAGVPVLYDAAHAFGSGTQAGMVGGFGSAEVFSFHATKFVNSFEGAAVTTDDDALAERLRLLRNFGFVGYDRVDHLGINGKMPEVCAAMGITSLEAIDGFLARNRANLDAYRGALAGIPGVELVEPSPAGPHNHQYVVVEVDEAAAGIHRDVVVEALWAENVRARRYFSPGCHRSEPYAGEQHGVGERLPVTEALCERVLVLPTGTSVTPEVAADIGALVGLVVEGAPALAAALRR